MRVLTWNLYHGRSEPAAGRELSAEFASLLASWDWDAALLQEVPPWWPPLLASAAGAEQRAALTSRNAGRIVRRGLARRWPDVIKSNGGGCNAILARAPIVMHHALRLRTWPERRVAQLARLGTGVCLANYHASAWASLAQLELERLSADVLAWAGQAPLVLGGDLNHARPTHIQASPLNWVTPDAAPTLAIQGTKDRYVAYEQSVWIIDRLLGAGVEAELETIDGADHGFKGADAERAEQRMLAFFDRYLKPR